MKKYRTQLHQALLALCMLICSMQVRAQSSSVYINGPYYISTGTSEQWYGDAVLGPDARLYIQDGARIFFYGASMKVSPGAIIYGANSNWTTFTPGAGTGSIVFRQPNPNGNTVVQQTLDGGNSGSATLNTFTSIEVENPNGVKLINSNTRVGTKVSFVAGHVYCDTRDMVLATTATIGGYDVARFFVTGSTGSLVKEGQTNTAFTYPVGASASAGFYLPVTLTNAGTSDRYSVRALLSPGNPATYITASWQIKEGTAGGSNVTLALQHNTATNQGAGYTDASSKVMISATGTDWGTATGPAATTTTGTVAGSSVKTMTGLTDFSTNTYFTKGVSGSLWLAARVYLQGAWNGTTMTNTLRTLNLIPATQPYNSAAFNYAGTEATMAMPAKTTDWVLVELLDPANPSIVKGRRAGLLLQNGSVVDVDGSSALRFSDMPSGNYYVAVRHRNHLGIRSATALTFAESPTLPATPTPCDFTTAQAQAYQNPAITTNAAQAALSGGVFGLIGGNGANSGAGAGTVRMTGSPVVNDLLALSNILGTVTVLGPVYSLVDYNMNGYVRASGAPAINDLVFLQTVLGINLIISQHQ